MFSENEQLDQKTRVFKKLHTYLMGNRKEKLGSSASPEQLEEARSETRETAQLIAENYSQQLEGLYTIARKLKSEGYRELGSLVWQIEYATITAEEVQILSKNIDELLSQHITQDEIKLGIKAALQPFIERNATHLRAKIEENKQKTAEDIQLASAVRQQAEEFEREMQAAGLRADSKARARQAAEQQAEEFKQKIREMEQQLSALNEKKLNPKDISSNRPSNTNVAQSSPSVSDDRNMDTDADTPLLLSGSRKRKSSDALSNERSEKRHDEKSNLPSLRNECSLS